MSLGTDYVTPENRVATSDARFDVRLTENFDDDEASSGWTWVTALLIAGTLIVSGYLDQESANFASPAASAVADRHVSNTGTPQTLAKSLVSAEQRLVKGY